jgi:hypothetical protein
MLQHKQRSLGSNWKLAKNIGIKGLFEGSGVNMARIVVQTMATSFYNITIGSLIGFT